MMGLQTLGYRLPRHHRAAIPAVFHSVGLAMVAFPAHHIRGVKVMTSDHCCTSRLSARIFAAGVILGLTAYAALAVPPIPRAGGLLISWETAFPTTPPVG